MNQQHKQQCFVARTASGGRLSEGQRQMVAFARAFLADPTALVLDGATSSLDVPTERAVRRALESVLAVRTALIGGTGGRFATLHRTWRESLA